MCQPFFRQAQTEAFYSSQSCAKSQKRYDPLAKKLRVDGRLYHLGEPTFEESEHWLNVWWIHWDAIRPLTGKRISFQIVFWLEDEVFHEKPRPTEKQLLQIARRMIKEHLAQGDKSSLVRLGDEFLIKGLAEQGPLPARKTRRI